MDTLTLHRKGLKQRTIAGKLAISRNTVKIHIVSRPCFNSEKTEAAKKLVRFVPGPQGQYNEKKNTKLIWWFFGHNNNNFWVCSKS